MTATELGIYVYGLVARGALEAPPALSGIDDAHAVECITEGELCALVSMVELRQFDEQPLREHLADMRWVARVATRHQLVMDAVLDRCTPIPTRLCTVYSGEDALRGMLDREQKDLVAALAELDGKLEWGVQLFESGRPEAASPATAPASTAVASGTAYLQQKLAARDAGERQHADLELVCERLHAELNTIALASRLGIPQRAELSGHRTPMILNAFYLVPNAERESFRARVTELDGELGGAGIELVLTGPWAPYNFIPATAGSTQ